MSVSESEPLTWERLAMLEPALKRLEHDIQAGGPHTIMKWIRKYEQLQPYYTNTVVAVMPKAKSWPISLITTSYSNW